MPRVEDIRIALAMRAGHKHGSVGARHWLGRGDWANEKGCPS